jgi:hypothetical protein
MFKQYESPTKIKNPRAFPPTQRHDSVSVLQFGIIAGATATALPAAIAKELKLLGKDWLSE